MKNRVHRQAFLDHSSRWQQERHARINAQRDPVNVGLYSSAAWRSLRAQVIREAAGVCDVEGCSERATVVDHREPHDGDNTKFFDRENLRAVCKPHHDQKTAAHDGGFGNPKKERRR